MNAPLSKGEFPELRAPCRSRDFRTSVSHNVVTSKLASGGICALDVHEQSIHRVRHPCLGLISLDFEDGQEHRSSKVPSGKLVAIEDHMEGPR